MKKILIIDDDIIARSLLKKHFESQGIVVIQSSNGRHAWETLWENPDISLLISDIMMPDMNGRELLQIIRGNGSFQKLPVIVVSGVVRQEEVADLMELGNTYFLSKPVHVSEISAMVNEILDEKYAHPH